MVVLGQFLTRYLVVSRDFYRTSTMATMAARILELDAPSTRSKRDIWRPYDGNLAATSNSSETPST